MRIGELAESTGVSARSLRYYEAQGLIRSCRSPGGWRDFDEDTVERVILIQYLFAAGLGSRTIDQVLPCLEAPLEERTGVLEDLLEREVSRLEERRRDLDRELDTLRALQSETRVDTVRTSWRLEPDTGVRAEHQGMTNTCDPAEPTSNTPAVRQLRLVIEAADFDAARAFFQDALGMSALAAFSEADDAQVVILDAGRATLEITNPAHKRFIDDVEAEGRPSTPIRLALEVDDTAAVTQRAVDGGAQLTAEPRLTPWLSVNARLAAPSLPDLDLTLFQETMESDH
ncbi:MerR family transcriptional regulator [Kocuria soli]|uniref:MerR family transcriptional regulator n=1 Tax=Kocuria soli TaxID=2485125 RepID=UPI001F3B096C|nr:MerR family transcriptional regulator [Kocuria soli]